MPDVGETPGPCSDRTMRRTASNGVVWTAVFGAVFSLYAATASRGVQWQDSGEQILRIATGQLEHRLGLALIHPLQFWLGRTAVQLHFLEPAFAITLVSSAAMAIAVANVFGCVLTLTGRRGAALLGAGSLAMAHTVWQLATRTESYAITAALLSVEVWCLASYARHGGRTRLWFLTFLNGLGLANHTLALLTAPVVGGVWVHELARRRVSARDAVVASGGWLIGSLPYTVLIVHRWIESGDASGTLHSALFGDKYAHAVLNVSMSVGMIVQRVGFVLLNFPNLLLPVALCGMLRAVRAGVPRLAVTALGAALAIHVTFALRYDVIDWHEFLLPSLVLLSVFGGIGFAAVQNLCTPLEVRGILRVSVLLLALTPTWYAALPTVARRLNVLAGVERNKPYRDDYVYVFAPWSFVERSAQRLSREAVSLAGTDGVIIVEDGMASFAVEYEVLRRGWDCTVITIIPASPEFQDLDPMIPVALQAIRDAGRQGYRVVLVPHDVSAPRTVPPIGSWRRFGDLYLWQPE